MSEYQGIEKPIAADEVAQGTIPATQDREKRYLMIDLAEADGEAVEALLRSIAEAKGTRTEQ